MHRTWLLCLGLQDKEVKNSEYYLKKMLLEKHKEAGGKVFLAEDFHWMSDEETREQARAHFAQVCLMADVRWSSSWGRFGSIFSFCRKCQYKIKDFQKSLKEKDKILTLEARLENNLNVLKKEIFDKVVALDQIIFL